LFPSRLLGAALRTFVARRCAVGAAGGPFGAAIVVFSGETIVMAEGECDRGVWTIQPLHEATQHSFPRRAIVSRSSSCSRGYWK